MGKCAKDELAGERPKKRHRKRKLLIWTAVGLTAAAVGQELRKPQAERTWAGRVAGVVPYDLRWPVTEDRVRAAVWNPGSEELFTPHAFGVGWSVNFARVIELAENAIGEKAVAGGRR